MGKDSVLLMLELTAPDVRIILDKFTGHTPKLDCCQDALVSVSPVRTPAYNRVPGDACRLGHQSRIFACKFFIILRERVMDHVPLVAGLKPHPHDRRTT